MNTAKAAGRMLLLVWALLSGGHWSYSRIPAAKKKARLTKAGQRKMKHKVQVAHRPAVVTARATGPVYTVTATAYQAVASQTDKHPFVTADNTIIKRSYSSRLRWLAVSRDLLRQGGGRIHYGDKVRVGGVSPKLDGIYTVHDTMHKRHRHRIDILSSPREKLALSTKNVKLRLIKTAAVRKQQAQKPALAAKRTDRRGRPVATRPARTHSRGHAGRATYLTAAIL